jgi:CRISP-associated protein Cas1
MRRQSDFCIPASRLSFVYDIADIVKLETVVPEAFRVAAAAQQGRPLEGRPVLDRVS